MVMLRARERIKLHKTQTNSEVTHPVDFCCDAQLQTWRKQVATKEPMR